MNFTMDTVYWAKRGTADARYKSTQLLEKDNWTHFSNGKAYRDAYKLERLRLLLLKK